MKILFSTLALSGLLASLAPGITVTGRPTEEFVTSTVDWTITKDYQARTITYATRIIGNYEIDLGDASITGSSGGSLAIFTTNTDWATQYGIGLVASTDPYDLQGYTEQQNQAGTEVQGHTAVYICRPGTNTQAGHTNWQHAIEYFVNDYRYVFSDERRDGVGPTQEYYDDNGVKHTDIPNQQIILPNTVYSAAASGSNYTADQATGAKLTFGYTLSAATNPETGEFLGLVFATPRTYVVEQSLINGLEGDVTLQPDVWIEEADGSNDVQLVNFNRQFDLTRLVSYGQSYVDTQESYAFDEDAETYIIITKALSAEDMIPEPATATLSLLALAGLAARRRRQG